MKKIAIIILLAVSTSAQAYSIGGAYATLIDCSYGKYGYQYGNIGTYRLASGEYYQVFFGSNYCQY